MARIKAAGGQRLLRAQKTLTLDGTSGNGAVGTVTIFTITGRVTIIDVETFCTGAMTGATGTIALGTASLPTTLVTTTTATDLTLNEFWLDATPTEVGLMASPAAVKDIKCSENIILTVAVAAVSGAIMFTVWYAPTTSDGFLS